MGKLCVRTGWMGLFCGALVGGLIASPAWAQGASAATVPARAAASAVPGSTVAAPPGVTLTKPAPASSAATASPGASGAPGTAATAAMPDASSAMGSASAATEGAASAAETASTASSTPPIVRPGFSGGESSLPGLGVTLLGVAVVLLAAAWLFQRQRRRNEASSTHVFQVLGSVPLGGRDRLHLVQVEQQFFVIGHTPSQITFLSEVKPGAAPANEVAPPQPPSWNEAQDSMNAFFKQVEQSRP